MLSVFRSPPNYNRQIETVITSLSDTVADQYLICGDFNYRNIDWTTHTVNSSELSDEQQFYDTVQSSYLHQHVEEFTRLRGRDQPSTLDLVFSKNELEIEFIDYKDPFGKSDHSVLVFDFILEGELDKAENETPKRKVFKGDFHNMTLLFNTTLGYTHLL